MDLDGGHRGTSRGMVSEQFGRVQGVTLRSHRAQIMHFHTSELAGEELGELQKARGYCSIVKRKLADLSFTRLATTGGGLRKYQRSRLRSNWLVNRDHSGVNGNRAVKMSVHIRTRVDE